MNFEQAKGMAGPWINVNLAATPVNFGNSRRICSDRTRSAAGHLTTVWDSNTPKSDGVPIYEPVWRHMLGVPPREGAAAPEPVAPNTPVAVADCDAYVSVKQRWRWDAGSGTLGLAEHGSNVAVKSKQTRS